MYKDIFVNRIYHFDAQSPDPIILDCGSNIGMSILYFKHIYPKARITAFEPDPSIFPCLRENMIRNGLTDVRLVNACLSEKAGSTTFHSDGKYGSSAVKQLPADASHNAWTKYEVPTVRLRDYLEAPVDFLKMNIEGSEYRVLEDSRDRLRMIREMVIEYHHLPRLPRTLHKILPLLDCQGFEYLVSNFDSETNPSAKPPFHSTPETRYFLLVYARRAD
jgi:FkbM family methyltransferase